MVLNRSHLYIVPLDEIVEQKDYIKVNGKGTDWSASLWRLKGISIVIIALYLDNGIGPAGRNLIKLAEIQTFLLKTGRHFVILADWNFEPHQLAELDWLSSIQGEIVMPSDLQITCS